MANDNILAQSAGGPDISGPRKVDVSIRRCSGERTILVVFGRGLIASLRTQNERQRCRDQEIDEHGGQSVIRGEAEAGIEMADERDIPINA